MDSENGFVMAGGDGKESYTKNSSYQRAVIDSSKSLVQISITEHIDQLIMTNTSSPSQTFSIADLGCSVGPNTFTAVQNIIETIKLKYSNSISDESTFPEFQVHFSDHALNDFNTLFKSLSPDREYYASGVPGSFYTRLFPRASLHVVHCSSSLQWLSQVPSEITVRNSGAYNKGRIHNVGDDEGITNAYSRQFAADLFKFLDARAQELVPGGLVMLVLPARPDGVQHSRVLLSIMIGMIGECLMDLAKEGVIDEEKLDGFNVPIHFACPHEMEEVVKQNGRFGIEKMEGLAEVKGTNLFPSPQQVSLSMRAATEELIKKQFGHEILDQVFGTLFPEKFMKGVGRIMSSSALSLFVLLKLKQDSAAV
ncbi:hypothetical protein OROHE_007831 [Orobanche hederae]